MKCPICEKLYKTDSEMDVMEKYESQLGLNCIYTIACENCGLIMKNIIIEKSLVPDFEKMFNLEVEK